MQKRPLILIGMALGALWASGLVWLGAQLVIPPFLLLPVLALAFLLPGLVLLAMIAVVAASRFFAGGAIDGGAFPEGSAGAIHDRVLRNTVEQGVLAAMLWPALGYMLGDKGPGVVLMLGLGFAVARLAFWIGYLKAPALRAFGFAATFYPTIAAALFAAWYLPNWVSGLIQSFG